MAILSGHPGLGLAQKGFPRAILVALFFAAAAPVYPAVNPAVASPVYIWPNCDTTHPCVVHHIDTVGDGTAYGETLQDFKFPMVPSSPGNLLIFTVMHVSSKSITVTDNNGGSWQTAVTTTNSSDGEESDLLYICGAASGTNLITIHLSQPAAHDEPLHFTYDEVSGVAPSACLDGTAAANGLKDIVQPGPVTTTIDGDMIFNYGEETYQYPEYDAPIGGVTADSSSALLMENIVDKYASEVSLQAAHGAFTPTLTVNADPSPRNWNSVAAAFIPSVGAGTQPTGIHVTRILHYVGIEEKTVTVPFPSSGNAIVISTSNPSVGGWDMASLTDNAGHTYTRVPFTNGDTDPQIFSTCLGTGPGGQNLVISWTGSTINNHVLFYDIAGANTTGGSTGCVGTTVDTVIGYQGATPNAPMIGDPVITPSTAGSVIVTTSYCGTGPPSGLLTPNAVFNSIWATGMIDSSSWDTGDPYAYAYTTSTSPISFNYQMANANGEANGGTNFDGAAIEIIPVQYPLTSLAIAPQNPSIATGASQQFTATGTLSDETQQDVTAQASWTSSPTTTATINNAGLATGLCAGTATISASLSGFSDQTSLQVTGLGNTATTVSSSLNPSPPNQSITFTAGVTSSCGTPTGAVQFVIDGTNYGAPVPLGGSGTASTAATLSTGNHTVQAMYTGSGTLMASGSSGLAQAVNTITPTLAVMNSPVLYNGTPQAAVIASSVQGTVSNVLYSGSATIPAAVGTYVVTATFTPSDTTDYTILTSVSVGSFVISRATPVLAITNSPATYTGSSQAVAISSSTPGTISSVLYSGSSKTPSKAGSYAITASFKPSDTNDYGSLAGVSVGSFVINKATPTLRVTNSPVTFNGSARTASVSGSVSGSVSSVQYSGSSTAPASAGTYAITASFTPSDTTDYNSLAGAAAGNFVINKATPTLKMTNSSVTYSGYPQSPTVNGSVQGTVTAVFYSGSSTTPINAATYAVTANFIPADSTDYNTLTGASAGNFVINKATPSIALSSSPNPSTAGTSVTFIATLPASATGTVTFKDGGSTISTGTLTAGRISWSTSSLARGKHSITASYGGDANNKTATSSTLKQTVN
jgi:Bacterial Ig-like domain (group 3)/Bacterial Ig-like domain (group 2)/MBG domain